ncbi:MAG: AraC family transcriptional regulator [Verrucomicrobiota bacterium JB022]|nr:AraC family transcriptional regulator [Verrucomicrobiota bacterium JB022]
MHIRTNLVWIYEGDVLKSVRQGTFPPGDLAAWLILEGGCELKAENVTVKAGAGDWLFPWPGRRFQSFEEGSRILSIRFQARWPDKRPLFDHGLSVSFPAQLHPELEVAARNLLGSCADLPREDPFLFRKSQLTFDKFLQVKAALLQWMSEYYRVLVQMGIKPTRMGISDERVAEALHVLDELPLDTRFSEVDLGAAQGLSSGQFVRIFRKEMGVTPKRYFEERRRDFARRMLAITNVPIKQIALELGFLRLSDFSSWTRTFCDASPRDYRKRYTDEVEDDAD